ncbi:MAG: exodeoxyribonuclease VII small subunit [Nocardioides sp.]|nr:exodeoxyribonuclease VII small subunit [Nocardioides sp.]
MPDKTAKKAAAEAAPEAEQEQLSYEQAREELVDVVRRLETGGTTLEESLALWERGETLARTCQDFLDGARERLEEVMNQEPDSE